MLVLPAYIPTSVADSTAPSGSRRYRDCSCGTADAAQAGHFEFAVAEVRPGVAHEAAAFADKQLEAVLTSNHASRFAMPNTA